MKAVWLEKNCGTGEFSFVLILPIKEWRSDGWWNREEIIDVESGDDKMVMMIIIIIKYI